MAERVVQEAEPGNLARSRRGAAVGVDRGRAVEVDRVVFQGNVTRLVTDQEKPARPPERFRDRVKQVVANSDAIGLRAGVRRIEAEYAHPPGNISHHVVTEENVLDHTPVAAAVLI